MKQKFWLFFLVSFILAACYPTDKQNPQGNGEEKIIILCENCGQKLRLPILSRRKSLRVTCPKCR
jgi:ssDNA-binding Zn-finger/Zn-ribbon topoisomerase 1